MLSRRHILCAVFSLAATAAAQQLAHPGWRGNSIAPEAWWKHAVIVRFPDDCTFAAVTKSLDALSSAGADTLLLPDPGPAETQPFAQRFGTEDELDTLLRETAARRMHVLLRMPVGRAAANPAELRYWMNRGFAGLDLGTLGSGDLNDTRTVRAALDHYAGLRILIAHTPGLNTTSTHARHRTADPITLHLVTDGESTSAGQSQAVEVESSAALASLANRATPILPGSLLADEAGRNALRLALNKRGLRGGGPAAVLLDPDAPPTGPDPRSRHRRHRRSHPSGR